MKQSGLGESTMKNKLMPMRSIASIGEDLVALSKMNQLGRLEATTSILSDARSGNVATNKIATNKSLFKNEYIIVFENFIMVPFDPNSESDYKEYRSIVMDEEIMKTVSVFNCKVPSEEEARKSYDALTEINRISDIPLSYKIISSDGDLMGVIMPAILEKDKDGKAIIMDFGHLFKKHYRGHSALIANSVLRKQCFKKYGCQKVIASSFHDNYNSQAIALRLGFEYIGLIKKDEGKLLINIFELTKEKFLATEFKTVKIKNLKSYIDSMPNNSSHQYFIKPFCIRN